MNNWIEVSGDYFPSTDLSVEDYRRRAALSWAENSATWSAHTIYDHFHAAVFDRVFGAVDAEAQARGGKLDSLADCGCGAGALIERIQREISVGAIAGIDSCSAFVRPSSSGSVTYLERDLEGFEPLLPFNVQVATCVLTLIEIADVAAAMRNIAKALLPGGVALVAVLDPTVEFLRFVKWKLNTNGAAAFNVAGELVIASHFLAGGLQSPQPYYRFIRPMDSYVDAGLQASLQLESIQAISIGGPKMPRGVLLTLRR